MPATPACPRASGTWVSFPDPDDVLDPAVPRPGSDSFWNVSDASLDLAVHPRADARRQHGREPRHPPAAPQVQPGAPNWSTWSTTRSTSTCRRHRPSTGGRRSRSVGLLFDESIRPNFEDASFTALYLSTFDEPQLGIVADALYHYRRPALTAARSCSGAGRQESKYTTVLERGYLGLLRKIKERRGAVPIWAQNTVLYDLFFYYRHEQSTHGATAVARPAWTDRFHALAAADLQLHRHRHIDAFSMMPTSRQLESARSSATTANAPCRRSSV